MMREYDEGMTDFESAAKQIEEIWRKMEIRELSGAEGQKSLHTKTILNWKTLRKEALRKEAPAKDRDNLKHGVKVDYTVALALGERDGYTVLFGGDIPKSDASACRWCGKYHKPDVNCGPTFETKLKSKDEIDKLVANVSTMVKIFEKEKASRSNEEDKKLTEFIQKAKDIVARLQAPSDRTHDGKRGLPKQSKDCFRWTKTGHLRGQGQGMPVRA